MISVIIPVYNVEPYLRTCLDSVVNQTYKDLEILVIDDGSTDRSGAICDEYAAIDSRIRVFHTENRGLSCARNLCLDEAQGEWIGFVDSDDWIEPDMYEVLLRRAGETGADVIECGVFLEYPKNSLTWDRKNQELSGSEAIILLIRGEISNAPWNKIWNKNCFESIRFPRNRVFEEHATTYRIYNCIDSVSIVDANKYHYRQRENSVSRQRCMKNLTDFWLSNKERMDALWDDVDEEGKKYLLRACSFAIARMWAYYYDCNEKDRTEYQCALFDMNAFMKKNIPLFGEKRWSLSLRVGTFLSHFNNAFSLRLSWMFNYMAQLVERRGSL